MSNKLAKSKDNTAGLKAAMDDLTNAIQRVVALSFNCGVDAALKEVKTLADKEAK